MALVLTTSGLNSLLSGALATSGSPVSDGILNNLKMGLFVNTPSLSQNTTLGSLTSPTTGAFPGYALSSTLNWNTVYQDSDKAVAVLSSTVSFSPSSAGTGATINGYWVQKGSGSPSVPMFAESFTNPVTLLDDLDALNVVVKFRCGGDDFGEAVVID